MQILETERLILRTWQYDDIDWFAAMNQDPEVMRYFPNRQDYAYTQRIIEGAIGQQDESGYSLYVVVIKATQEPIGFVGLLNLTMDFDAHFTPATEIGWRIKSAHWREGYAFEAASAVIRYAFETLGLQELVSFTAVTNLPSRRLMEKLHMQHEPKGDFNHPGIPADHPLSVHVLYRIKSPYTLA